MCFWKKYITNYLYIYLSEKNKNSILRIESRVNFEWTNEYCIHLLIYQINNDLRISIVL